jgi:3-dehydroquinate dehydratase-1
MICVPIKSGDENEVLKTFKECQKNDMVDLTELWLDDLKLAGKSQNFLEKIAHNKKKKIIYKSYGDLIKIERIFKNIKIDFIDLDIKTKKSAISKVKKMSPSTKIIISYHNFEKTPETRALKAIAKKISNMGADIIKIATYANSNKDSLNILKLLNDLTNSGNKAICIAMGKKGIFLRAAGHLFGNYLMYAPLKRTKKTAPGQLTVSEICRLK